MPASLIVVKPIVWNALSILRSRERDSNALPPLRQLLFVITRPSSAEGSVLVGSTNRFLIVKSAQPARRADPSLRS
jgi:hypothetical protein